MAPDTMLCHDVFGEILEYVPLVDMIPLTRTTRKLRSHVDWFLESLYNRRLAHFVPDPMAFRKLLFDTESVLSGSFPLSFALHALEQFAFEVGDLDLYCVDTTSGQIIDYLVDHAGYSIIDILPEDDNDTPYYGAGIQTVIRLFRSPACRMDIVVSAEFSSTYPLTMFWGTVVMNFMTADSICVTYPHTTLKGESLIDPMQLSSDRAVECTVKYLERGFTINWFSTPSPYHTSRTVARGYCPRTFRFFGDKACLVLSIGPEFHHTPERHRHSTSLEPFWSFGGSNCQRGCGGSNRTLVGLVGEFKSWN